MQPKFLEVQIARISAVFNRSKLQMDAVCDLETNVTKRWEPLFEYNRDRYFFYNRFRRNPEEFLSNRLLDIGRYTNALYFYKENLPELRKQFQFNDNILEAAQNVVNLAKANFSAVSNMTEVLLIGIHCRFSNYLKTSEIYFALPHVKLFPTSAHFRRTDLLSKVHRPAARYSRIDGNFYNQAMAMYRCIQARQKEEGEYLQNKVFPGSSTIKWISGSCSSPHLMTQSG